MSRPSDYVPLSPEQAQALVDAVAEREELALAVSAFEDENGEWVFEATCNGRPDLAPFRDIARRTLGGEVDFEVERIDPDTDWVARSLEGLPPVNAGGFFIHAGHNAHQVPPDVIPVHIEAAQAFGTGHHETTAGCLEAIYGVLKDRRPARILDVGTGTGVLAIAMAKRLRQTVVASDIDPVAVKTARDNAALNGVSQWIRAVRAEGLQSDEIARNGPYDLIVANILAGPLAELAPSISRAASDGAAVILSGILTTQAPDVLRAYAGENLVLNRRILLNEWSTLVLEKVRS